MPETEPVANTGGDRGRVVLPMLAGGPHIVRSGWVWLRMVLAAGAQWVRPLDFSFSRPNPRRPRLASAIALKRRVHAIGVIVASLALPVPGIGEDSTKGRSRFRFEEFKTNDLDLSAQEAEAALKSVFHTDSQIGEAVEYIERAGAECYFDFDQLGKIYCRYGHTFWITATFPPIPILQEWLVTVTFDPPDPARADVRGHDFPNRSLGPYTTSATIRLRKERLVCPAEP